MRPKLTLLLTSGLLVCGLGTISSTLADDAKAKEKITFADHVSAVFRSRCGSCHNPDKAKGGLNLDNYGAAMQGGGSGKVIEPGDPDGSSLLGVITHSEEPKMPPNSAKIPDAEIELIRKWIEGGALENSGSKAAAKAKPKFEFKLDPNALGKPAGPPAMPESIATEPFVPQAKPSAVVAMAASPWAPLVAVGGHKQVLLYRTTDNHLVGVLPFPEGSIHVLRFSRNGDLLLVGGGRGGQSGLAVAFNVKTGQRVFEVGKEYDAVLAADISPDHGQVALGGPSKFVRVFSTADGSLMFEMKKHTEWITAVEFSPDGVLLATGDRNNGLLAWEAQTGREFFDLRGHNAAITDISWRLDSNVFASSSEDGTVRLWEMENGGNIKSINAHGGGVESVRFLKDGRLVSSGRDRMIRVWDAGGNKQREFEAFGDVALEAVADHDASHVVAGDWSGEIRVWDMKDGRRIANLAVNPAPIATRLDLASRALAAARGEADSLTKQIGPLQAGVATAADSLAKAQQALAAADATAAKANASAAQAEQAARLKQAAVDEAKATAQAAEQLAAQAQAALAAAEKAVADSASTEKTATDALAAARTATEKAHADKAAHDPALAAAAAALKGAKTPEETARAAAELAKQTQRASELIAALAAAGSRQAAAQTAMVQATAAKAAAPQAVAPAQTRARAAALAVQAARDIVGKADQEKAVADKALADAKTAAQAAVAASGNLKKNVEQAAAAKAAADKALADRQAPLDAAAARAKALQAEIDALKIEAKRGAGRGPLAAAGTAESAAKH
ncbi:MAG: c-type cytochrome domain-containing protein [Isosphaeraceae bacterium]